MKPISSPYMSWPLERPMNVRYTYALDTGIPAAVTGIVTLPDAPDQSVSYRRDGDRAVITMRRGDQVVEFVVIDPRRPSPPTGNRRARRAAAARARRGDR